MLEEARDILVGLAERRPEAGFIYRTLGGIYWSLGDLTEAAESFGRSTQLAPKSELSSLALFSMLLKVGRREEAYAEMRRFRALGPSEGYRLLLEELRDQLTDEEYLRLVGEKKPPSV
jgi:predicted Zn-dependent protease